MTIDRLIDQVIGREGGYSDHPADRGGPTMWGITEQVARAYGYVGDMARMPRATAVAIYGRRYWTDIGLDKVDQVLPDVAAELFDVAVNMGPGAAGGFLQRGLNVLNRGAADWPDVATDGLLGAVTIQALRSYLARRPGAEGRAVLLWLVRALRTARYVAIGEADKSQEVFEYGWIARCVRSAGQVGA